MQIGDRVRLKTGGYIMQVVDYKFDKFICTWRDHLGTHLQEYKVDELNILDKTTVRPLMKTDRRNCCGG